MPKIYKGNCRSCGKFYRGRGQLFCSRSCQRSYLNKINNPAKNPESKIKIAKSRIGKSTGSNEKHWNWQGKKNLKSYCLKCGIELKTIYYGKKKPKHCFKCSRLSGQEHPCWKGGTTPQRIKEYQTLEYKNFVDKVLKRDNYVCQICKRKNSTNNKIKLEVHHIKSYAEYPELRFDIDNGITLCKECHLNTIRKKKMPKRIDFIQNNPQPCLICKKPMKHRNARKYCLECRKKYCCTVCGSTKCTHRARRLWNEYKAA